MPEVAVIVIGAVMVLLSLHLGNQGHLRTGRALWVYGLLLVVYGAVFLVGEMVIS